jgi:heavy metal translocating P-type ATPase
VSLARHERVRSGASNAGDPFELRASCPAAESAYASLVRLVENAQGQRAPFVRLADRYAIWFLALTVIVSGAGWVTSGSAVTAVAVLVVATPCPLILAAPIALASGISRAARRGIIIKGGAVIEQLGAARTVLFDKTGTLTYGAPEIAEIVVAGDVLPDQLLAAVASLEQHSVHVVAEALVRAAVARGLTLTEPTDVHETPGDGIAGTVAGRRVAAGNAAFIVAQTGGAARPTEAAPGRASVHVALDGQPGGSIILADRLRDDAHELVSTLHAMGVGHVAMVTGDRADVARLIGDEVGVDAVYAEQTPEAKLEVVRALRARPELCAVVMVGDGVNDAPALTLASVGIAMAGHGATVSSETADAVITVDRVDRVADAIAIGRRSMAIARQSVVAGMALSIVAMAVAAAGYLPPVEGALLQELIDVAVIVNALRALR